VSYHIRKRKEGGTVERIIRLGHSVGITGRRNPNHAKEKPRADGEVAENGKEAKEKLVKD